MSSSLPHNAAERNLVSSRDRSLQPDGEKEFDSLRGTRDLIHDLNSEATKKVPNIEPSREGLSAERHILDRHAKIKDSDESIGLLSGVDTDKYVSHVSRSGKPAPLKATDNLPSKEEQLFETENALMGQSGVLERAPVHGWTAHDKYVNVDNSGADLRQAPVPLDDHGNRFEPLADIPEAATDLTETEAGGKSKTGGMLESARSGLSSLTSTVTAPFSSLASGVSSATNTVTGAVAHTISDLKDKVLGSGSGSTMDQGNKDQAGGTRIELDQGDAGDELAKDNNAATTTPSAGGGLTGTLSSALQSAKSLLGMKKEGDLSDKASDLSDKASGKASDLKATATSKLDELTESGSTATSTSGSSLKDKASGLMDKASDLVGSAKEKLHNLHLGGSKSSDQSTDTSQSDVSGGSSEESSGPSSDQGSRQQHAEEIRNMWQKTNRGAGSSDASDRSRAPHQQPAKPMSRRQHASGNE